MKSLIKTTYAHTRSKSLKSVFLSGTLPKGSNGTQLPGLAVIGCGQIAESCLLPAMLEIGWRPALLVEKDSTQLHKLAKQFGAAAACETIDKADLSDLDGAIVSLPNHLHEPVCCELLKQGIHVLVEKPMARTSDECASIIAAAQSGKAQLGVAHVYRFRKLNQWIHALIKSGIAGPVKRFDIRVGNPFSWPVKSASIWNKHQSGGGALIDVGVHVIDLLLWWFNDLNIIEYLDDSESGVEAECHLTLSTDNGASGVLELSRTRQLRNTVIIDCEKGSLEVGIFDGSIIRAKGAACEFSYADTMLSNMPDEPWNTLFVYELKDFANAILESHPPLVSPSDGARAVAFVESCYSQRKPYIYPWDLKEGA